MLTIFFPTARSESEQRLWAGHDVRSRTASGPASRLRRVTETRWRDGAEWSGRVHERKSLSWWLRLRIQGLGRYCPCVIPVQLHSRHARVVLSAKSMLSNYQGGLAVSCLCRTRSRLPSTSQPQVQSPTSSVPTQILSPVPPRVLDPTLKVLPHVQLPNQTDNNSSPNSSKAP